MELFEKFEYAGKTFVIIYIDKNCCVAKEDGDYEGFEDMAVFENDGEKYVAVVDPKVVSSVVANMLIDSKKNNKKSK